MRLLFYMLHLNRVIWNRTLTYAIENIAAIRTHTRPYARHTQCQSDSRHDWRLSNVATARSAPNSGRERTFKSSNSAPSWEIISISLLSNV